MKYSNLFKCFLALALSLSFFSQVYSQTNSTELALAAPEAPSYFYIKLGATDGGYTFGEVSFLNHYFGLNKACAVPVGEKPWIAQTNPNGTITYIQNYLCPELFDIETISETKFVLVFRQSNPPIEALYKIKNSTNTITIGGFLCAGNKDRFISNSTVSPFFNDPTIFTPSTVPDPFLQCY